MIDLMNEARYFLPHLLALSTSSPFWMGRDTGLKSYRTTVFRRFPRTGIPDHLSSWSRVRAATSNMLVELHCIDNGKKIWWDLRPHPTFGTLEFRICDVPTAPRAVDRDCRAGAGDHRQAVSAARAQSRLPPLPPRPDRREQMARRPLGHRRQADRLRQARSRCRCASSRWNCSSSSTMWSTTSDSRREVEYVEQILADGTSAERQLQVYRETGDLRAVVRSLVDETRATSSAAQHSYHVLSDEDRPAVRAGVFVSARVPRSRQHARPAARHHRRIPRS